MPVIPKHGAVCKFCKKHRDQSDFYLQNLKTGNCSSKCAFCKADAYRARHPKIVDREVMEDEQRCSSCKQVLSIYDFAWRMRNGMRRPRTICEDCAAGKRAAYKEHNKEQIKARSAAYREAHREEIAEKQRRWREQNPERYYEIHAAAKKRNKIALRAAAHRRRLQRDAAPGTYTAKEWQELKVQYDYRCLMCYRREPEIILTVDHIVPISKGGSNTIDNLQPLCKGCNSRKHVAIVDLRLVS
jgi:5-methylcytosine-specific restriction endonuclease McrA